MYNRIDNLALEKLQADGLNSTPVEERNKTELAVFLIRFLLGVITENFMIGPHVQEMISVGYVWKRKKVQYLRLYRLQFFGSFRNLEYMIYYCISFLFTANL